ncbi:hypothetical protein Droror1_Dr00025455 [Drosera rotundifolia]
MASKRILKDLQKDPGTSCSTEHVLLLIKFGFSRLVREEPAWVRANRMKNVTNAQDVCSKQLLRNISNKEMSRQKKVE